jgi:hypothetical protein
MGRIAARVVGDGLCGVGAQHETRSFAAIASTIVSGRMERFDFKFTPDRHA